MRAWSRLQKRLADAPDLVLAGQKKLEYRNLVREAENAGLAGKVHFPGFIPDEDLPAVYSEAELFVFPSLYEGHLTPWGDKYGAVVFLMTGMHAIHVISGIIFILIVWNLGRKGHFSPSRKWGVESAAIYWHYVDLVWIFFYPAIYLIGTAVTH